MKNYTYFNHIKQIIILCCLMIVISLHSQNNENDYESGVLWVTIINSNLKPIENNSIKTQNEELNQIFSNFNVVSYTQLMPFAKTPILQNACEIYCNCDEKLWLYSKY